MHVFTVSELTSGVKEVLEGRFPFVWVRGQAGNISRPGSGHLYFTLKDEDAVLSVVWFKGSQGFVEPGGHDPVTGEVFENGRGVELTEGREVLCAGRLNVYPKRGAYQLVAELVQEYGLGRLYLEFEALKNRLGQKGYFDPDRKDKLPRGPAKVAVVTAPGAAAIRDFLRVASDRGLSSRIRIYPTLVQGEEAPKQIAEAVTSACESGWPQVVVLIRGGGSIEDLWAFNTEEVAEAVFQATVPVVTGIGHEVDTTIADLVADVRAATPSHAAQVLWIERAALAQDLDALDLDFARAFHDFFMARAERLSRVRQALLWLSPEKRVSRMLERFTREAGGLERAASAWLQSKAQDLALAEARLLGLDPEKPLERGFSLVRVEKTGRFLRSVRDVAPGDGLDVRVKDGSIGAQVKD
ncbi:MAG: exodeoxyribonuclease VII large subunit [Thermodesulfobacteriota bacterium]|nr:exodeoxyribonuclease VII large subunit [Thermodesulfobacteriota bacterium]